MTKENLYEAIGDIDDKYLRDIVSSDTCITAHPRDNSFLDERMIEVSVVRKKKKMTVFLIAALIAASFITAAAAFGLFRKNNDNQITQKKIENYFTDNGSYKTDVSHNIEYLAAGKERVYFSSYISGTDPVNKLAVIDRKTNRTKEIDISGLNLFRLQRVYLSDDCSFLFYTDKNNNNRICRLNSDFSYENAFDIKTEGYVYRITETDRNTVLFTETVPNGSEKSELKIFEYSKDLLEPVNTFSFGEIISSETYCDIKDVFLNGGFYYFVCEKESGQTDLIKKNINGDTVYLSEDICDDMEGEYSGCLISGSGDIVVFTSFLNSEGILCHSFDQISSETGEVVFRYDEILDTSSIPPYYINSVNSIDSEYDFEYINLIQGIIYGYSFENEEKTEIWKLNNSSKNINAASCSKDYILYGYSDGTGSEKGPGIFITDLNGSIIRKILLRQDKSNEYSNIPVHMYVNKNDELYLLKHIYDYESPTKDRTNDEVNTFEHYDRDGNLIETIKLSLPDTDEKLRSESRYRDYEEFIVREDGTIVCGYYNVVDFYNSDGTFREEYKIENNSGLHLVAGKNDYYAVAEGSEYYKTSGKIYRIEEKDDSLELICDFNFKVENQLFSGDEKYDFYVSEPEGIYGYKISENKMYEIINWIDSDMDAAPAAVAMIDSNRMICGVNDYLLNFDPNNFDYKISISMIERVSDEELKKIQSRDTVTIACDSISKPVMKKISEFNRTHEDCRITVREYGKYSDCGISGFNQFNRDLITGIIPDIIINSGTIDMKRYEELGMFTDLNDFIDGENGINRNDYYDSVFKVFSGNDVQYEIPLFFEINKIVGRKSDTGDISSVTFDELIRMSEEKRLFSGDSKGFVFDLIKKNITEFVDFSSYKCDFDNENFISLLNIINRESKEESNGHFTDFENKKCVFYCCELNSYYIEKLNEIKEDLVYIDYPSSGTEGTLISTSFSAAIAEKSENKECAWEFLKVLLSDDIQDTRNYEFFPEIPVKRSEAEEVLGNNYERISSMAESASRAVVYDSSINKIIDEQMEIYLNDGQNAAETAKNIQNKVSVYLKEIK